MRMSARFPLFPRPPDPGLVDDSGGQYINTKWQRLSLDFLAHHSRQFPSALIIPREERASVNGRYESMSVLEQVKAGLADSIAFSKGRFNAQDHEAACATAQGQTEDARCAAPKASMSQVVSAATLNVSPRTIQS